MARTLDPDQLDTLIDLASVIARNWRPKPPEVQPWISVAADRIPPALADLECRVRQMQPQILDAHERNGLIERAIEVLARLLKYAMGRGMGWNAWSDDDDELLDGFIDACYEKVFANGGFPDIERRVRGNFLERRGASPPSREGAVVAAQTN